MKLIHYSNIGHIGCLKNTGQVGNGSLDIKAPHEQSDLSDGVHIRLIYSSDLRRKQNN